MDYDLNGLNPRDFEHLVQALSLKAIAMGITPFGDGPDGGREATYDGKMAYPSATDPWQGYLVVQAKFQKKSTGVVAKDGAWLLKELRSDLAKFEDPKRKLRFPDYYLLATNVVLTPVSESGSKDRVFKVLEEFKQKGLKSYDIWDYDKICRLLDGSPEIYRHYAGFITSGDVLSRVMTVLEGQLPDFGEVMSLFLQKELRSDQFVKLEQAGHTTDQKTSLAHVFVDLAVTDQPVTEPPETSSTVGIVGEILQTGSNVLRASHLAADEVESDTKLTRTNGRYVVVGGPGQGKSTIGQFLCQTYRAAILQDCPAHTIAPEVRSVLNQIERQCQQDGIDLPSARRFPVRIVLDQFATDLANGRVTSLLNFVLKQIALGSQRDCSADDLRRWLKFYPWLIVLDGLDEVPATSNRIQVLETITEFFSQVAVLNADVLVVASTRPQGYNDEFSPRFYRHKYLSPLSERQALDYAERLTQARYAAEPERRQKILKRLGVALGQETTARLMRTPLQVTIMATLVDQIGQPPQERWRLFQQYYEVIYRRETERDIPASRILQQRKADVNAIHNRVGLLLQTESELAGNSEAHLSSSRFRKLVRSRIAEEGYEGEELELRVDEITQAALNRLVFLVGIESDRIGFEIRSLQEFTAAEALMDGGDEQVRARLEVIAPNAHWRNVFLFAVGKCFADRQFLRDMIVGICDQLNDLENDRLAGFTLAGSKLALDILQDGVAHEQPNFARSLARHSLKILDTDDEAAILRLSGIYTPILEKLFSDELSKAIADKGPGAAAAWQVLQRLAARNISWASELVDAQWPVEREEQIALFRKTITEVDEFAREKLAQILPPRDPQETAFLHIYARRAEGELMQWIKLRRESQNPTKPLATTLMSYASGPAPLDFRFRIKGVTNDSLTPYANLDLRLPGWALHQSAVRFEEEPSAAVLARELRWLSKYLKPDFRHFRSAFAWPFQACLSSCVSVNSLHELAEKVEAGKLGQASDWIAAEHRWTTEGIVEADLAYMTDDHWPFDNQIGAVGFPFASHAPSRFGDIWRVRSWEMLFRMYSEAKGSKLRSFISNLLYRLLNSPRRIGVQGQIDLSPTQLQVLCAEQPSIGMNFRIFDALKLPARLNQDWIDFFEWLGDNANYGFIGKSTIAYAEQLAHTYQEYRIPGLLKGLGAVAVSGTKCPVSKELLTEPFESHEMTRAALLIRTSQGKWSQDEARDMARQACGMPESFNTVSYLLRTLDNHRDTISHSQRVTLVLAVRDELITTNQSSARIGQTLNELIQSRPTVMGDPHQWSGLGLPATQ